MTGIFNWEVNIFSLQIHGCLKKNVYLCTDYSWCDDEFGRGLVNRYAVSDYWLCMLLLREMGLDDAGDVNCN